MPKVEQFSREQANKSLELLETNYFQVQEMFVSNVINESEILNNNLSKLKYGV